MPTRLKRITYWFLFAVAHAALTILFFLLYVDHAVKVEHGVVGPSLGRTLLQYLKSILFLPILLPVLHWKASLAAGPSDFLLVLVNSAVWACACWWIWKQVRRRRAGSA